MAANKAFGKEVCQPDGARLSELSGVVALGIAPQALDLSRKSPGDSAAYAKFIGESRVLRTTAVHVRPGT